MPFLVFEQESIGTFRLQVSDPRLPRHIQQSLQELEQVRFAYRGMELIDFLAVRPPDRFPYLFEWQQIEVLFDEQAGSSFLPPYTLRLNGQDTGLHSRASNGLHKLFGTLSLADAVGFTDLAIVDAEEGEVFYLQTEVFPQKLDYKRDFHYMVEEISQILNGLAYDYLRKTYALVEPTPHQQPESLEWLSMLRTLADSLERSLNLLLQMPHQQIRTETLVKPREQVRRVDSRAATWVQQHPQYRRRTARGVESSHLPEQRRSLSYDTAANQFVRWACEQILRQLSPLLPHLSARDRGLMETFARRLQQQLQHPVLAQASPLQAAPTHSTVLHLAAGYRDFYLRYLLLQQGLQLQEEARFQLDYKQVATLYEYWCFLKMVRILQEDARYALETQDLVQIAHDGLRVRLQKGQASRLTFRHRDTGALIQLWYNRRFGPEESFTFSQTPDHFIEFEKPGYTRPFRYILEAKYRFDRGSQDYPASKDAYGPPLDAIAQLHRYRDAILAQKEQQPTYTSALKSLGGVILFPYPQAEEQFRSHRFFQSQAEVNIGALPLKPGPQERHQLFRDFLNHLFESPPEALYEQAIEYDRRDQQDRIGEMQQQTLIGLIREDSHYAERVQFHLEQKAYYAPWTQGREQLAYVALYDQRQQAIIGFGPVQDYAVVNGATLERLGAHWPHRLRSKPYICYYWKQWQPCHLPYSGMQVGGIRYASLYGLKLALRHTQPDCLLLQGYAWFRIWEEVHAIDPTCRLVQHQDTLLIRFQYRNQPWRCQKTEKDAFLLLQPPARKWVYDLKTPLKRWLEQR